MYRKVTVHPSPVTEHLSFLPGKILALTAALSNEEKEVLAYIITCSFSSSFNGNTKGIADGEHPSLFDCTCFSCYTSYWSRWNSSPNHILIHEIIDTFEDFLYQNATQMEEKKNEKSSENEACELKQDELVTSSVSNAELESLGDNSSICSKGTIIDEDDVSEVGNGSSKLGGLRKCVSFIGKRFLCFWGR